MNPAIESPQTLPPTVALAAVRALDFDSVYQAYFDDMTCWLRAMGVPDAEIEDVAQEAFMVVERKLAGFDGGNLSGWLYRIASNMASDHRRSAWFRRFFRAARDEALGTMAHPDDPAASYEAREAQETVRKLMSRLSEAKRTALWLFEIEGYSGEEIAALQDVPLPTVWTRLHKARKEFTALAEKAAASSAIRRVGGRP